MKKWGDIAGTPRALLLGQDQRQRIHRRAQVCLPNIIEAEDLDAAEKIAKSNPYITGVRVDEIRTT